MARIIRFPLVGLALLLLLSVFGWAADQPNEVLVPNRQSPDGTTEIVLINLHDSDYNYERGTLIIRNIKSKKTLSKLDWSSWGWTPDSFKILWRPDSKCFAITYVASRGFSATGIYASFKREWVRLELPNSSKDILKKAKEVGEARVYVDEDWGGKGWERASAWFPHNSLRLDVAYRGIYEANEEAYQGFWVTLQIIDSDGKSKPTAVIKSVELQPGWRESRKKTEE